MDRSMNSLPTRTYVRCRVSTIVRDVGDSSQGSVELNLDKPSDVTMITVCSNDTGLPALFIAAIGRQPSLADFDVIVSPANYTALQGQSHVTLRLPAGETTFNWKTVSLAGEAQSFPALGSLLVLAIDQ